MANDKSFKIKNGLVAGRYLLSSGTATSGTQGYGIANATYDSVSLSLTAQDINPRGLAFKPDGTAFYTVGFTNRKIFQYSLSTAWDLSTASYASKDFSVSSQETSPVGVAFKPDGTKMYVCGTANDTVYQYSLSTAWDVSTASYDSKSFSVASQETAPYDLVFNDDGTKFILTGSQNDALYEYGLSTAYDISTASYNNVSFNPEAEANPFDLYITSDGTKLFIMNSGGEVNYYILSTAYDISTATKQSSVFELSGGAGGGIAFNPDGTKMYPLSYGIEFIYQYSSVDSLETLDLSTGSTFSLTVSTPTIISFTNPPTSGQGVGFTLEVNGDGSPITWPSSIKWHGGTAPSALVSKQLYAFVTTDGGTTYYGRRAAEGIA